MNGILCDIEIKVTVYECEEDGDRARRMWGGKSEAVNQEFSYMRPGVLLNKGVDFNNVTLTLLLNALNQIEDADGRRIGVRIPARDEAADELDNRRNDMMKGANSNG